MALDLGTYLVALAALTSLAACNGDDATLDGQETAACLDGLCLQGLECLSDVCVAPEGTGTTGTLGTTSATSTGTSATTILPTTTLPTTTTTDPTSTAASDDTSLTSSGGESTTASDDTTTGPPVQCDALDVLLVIDNSGSMAPKQARIQAALPAFLDDVHNATVSGDVNVMVVDTDAWVFGGCEAICPVFKNMCPGAGDAYVCGETMPGECEDVLGAGVTFPMGENAANEDCMFDSPMRYAELSAAGAREQIECAAQVGTGSSTATELPMEAMLAAVGAIGDAGPCNTGFSRNAVPLLVVFITDEEEGLDDSMVSPMAWHDNLVSARGGDASSIAVLGLIGDTGEPGASCAPLDGDPDGAEASPRLTEFIEMFGPRGVRGSICAPNYNGSFAEFVGVLDTICG